MGRLTLSIDAMGGDHAPDMVVEGVDLACRKLPHVEFLLFGDQQRLEPLLGKHARAQACCAIRHTDDVVTNEDKPSAALRQRRGSSMRLAINAVAEGEAAGVVSAGNTGALMAMAKFVLKTLPGIDRPAIAGYFPTYRGACVMLDLGANVECDAKNLVEFAVMGEVFARQTFNIDEPSVAILNVGVEDLKGHDEVKQASLMLQDANLPIKFRGFVEGDGIAAGGVDVVVTDGFTGNIALKAIEGTAKLFGASLREALGSSLMARTGGLLALPALRRLKQRMDPRLYNGAMFVGLNGICIKSHGGTDGLGFANAISAAARLAESGFNDRIKEDLARVMGSQGSANGRQAADGSVAREGASNS